MAHGVIDDDDEGGDGDSGGRGCVVHWVKHKNCVVHWEDDCDCGATNDDDDNDDDDVVEDTRRGEGASSSNDGIANTPPTLHPPTLRSLSSVAEEDAIRNDEDEEVEEEAEWGRVCWNGVPALDHESILAELRGEADESDACGDNSRRHTTTTPSSFCVSGSPSSLLLLRLSLVSSSSLHAAMSNEYCSERELRSLPPVASPH